LSVTIIGRLESFTRQHLARLDRGAAHAADATLVEGRARTEEDLVLDAARDGEVGARAYLREGEFEGLASLRRDARPHRHRLAVELGLHVGAGHREHSVALEPERRSDELALEPGGAHRIADEHVGEAEGPVVHRA
jgi:hypothetical protein